MTNENDYVLVGGNFYDRAYYSQSGQLTAGVLEVKGNFTEAGYNEKDFYATNNHKTIFSGNAKQTVSFDNLVSRFNIVEIRNTSEDGVVFSTPVTIDTVIDNGCNVTFANGERAGWILESDETFEGDLFLARGTLDLNGNKLNVTGNLIHSGGTILVNGGTLEVQGDYRVQAKNGTNYAASTGVLNMTNEADTVKVLGDFVMQSNVSHSGKLTAGTLEVGGDLIQLYANYYNLNTSGTHTIVLNGAEMQTVDIDNYNQSTINSLKITNTSSEGVTIDSYIYVTGNLYNTETPVYNSEKIYMLNTAVFADNTWNHNVRFTEDWTLGNDLYIGGMAVFNDSTFDLNGHTMTVGSVNLWSTTLKINGGQLLVNGNFNFGSASSYSRGYLQMTNENDYVLVGGNFYDRAYYSQSGKLTAGVLEVKGNFTQVTASNQYNFYPTGTHKTILSGNKVQAISFASNVSQFNILEITKPINTGYKFSRTPLWNTLIEGVPDTEPPTAPENLECVRSTSSSIMMTWDKSEDNKTVIGYNIYRDGELVGETSELQYIDNDLSSHSTYVYYVTACDIDGNESKWSNVIEAETDVDEFAPTQPINLSATVHSETTVNLIWTGSSDNGTVVKYNIYRNDILIGSSNGTSYTDNTAFSGLYEYRVEAVDNDDNTSKKSEKVIVDNAAPSAPELTLGSVNDLYIRLDWTGYDNVGIVRYDVYKNNLKIKTVEVTTYIDPDITIDSNYEYYVVAYDAYGNASEKSNIATVYTGEDDEVPTITGIQPISELNSGNAVIRISAKDNRGLDKIFIEASSNNVDWTAAGMVSASKGTSETVNCAVDTTAYPDGKLYIRAYAEDIKGNIGLASDSPICEITVDNTAPAVPSGLTVNLYNSQIEVRWDLPEDEDTAYYRIYRKTDSDSKFTLIKDNYKYRNYFDTNIELDVNYTYCVSAVDSMGNESAMSSEVSGSVADDKVIPEIISIYPKNGEILETSQIVGISAKDNFRLSSLNVECRPANGEWYTVFSEENINNYAKAVQFELDTSSFTTGSYELRAYAYDTAGNISEYAVGNYTFKECTLSAPVLSATGEGWRNELSWTMGNTEDLLGYHIYRRTLTNSEFSLIASIKDNKYTDSSVIPGTVYHYYVEAFDSRNNYVKSSEVVSTPTSEDDILPLADAGCDVLGIVGETVNFSSVNSWDNHYITSYVWDFGDGTTSDYAVATHIYENEGTYDVTLTVTDSAGNSDTHTIKAYIYSNDYGYVQFKTTDTTGKILGGVNIYCEIPGVDSTDFVTDSSGNFKFIAPKGTYDVYFYKNEYLPKYVPITVTDGTTTSKVKLEQKELLDGELTVTPLDINEIAALGIDVTAPENQFVYEYKIDYKKNGVLTLTVNAMGDIIGEVNGAIQTERDGVITTVATLKGEKDRAVSVSYGGSSDPDNLGGSGEPEDPEDPEKLISGGGRRKVRLPVSVAVFNVTTELSWLKEFFDVEIAIINNADDDFYIQNSQAVLTLPDGLSLAGTDRKESLVQVMGNNGVIGSNETKSASWIVRGDKPGSYDISAEFTGTLMPLSEEVKVIFKNESPLVVHTGEGLKLDITITEGLDYWTNQFTFTNNSDRPIYNFAASFSGSAELAEVTDMIIKYPSGATEIIKWNDGIPDEESSELYISVLATDYESVYDLRTINPGETVTGYFSILRDDGYNNDER